MRKLNVVVEEEVWEWSAGGMQSLDNLWTSDEARFGVFVPFALAC